MEQSRNTMKVWYIVAVAVLLAVCLVCMILSLTMSGDKYFQLTYEEFDGVTYISDISSGADVKDGTVVRFTILIDETKATGEPVVKTNGQNIVKRDKDGYYSFVMNSDTVVKIYNMTKVKSYGVTFDAGETRTRFKNSDGYITDSMNVKAGKKLSFEIVPSVYFVGDPIVLANTTVLEPDENGVYSFDVKQNTTITINGLEMEEPFYRREDFGEGTAANPYKISRPVDLYAIADLIAEGFYVDMMFAYYELTDDIDFNGEQLYIIGDATAETSLFAGHFNGNGHTVSNFFIEDYIIEQSTFTSVKLPYLGMFGYVSSTSYGVAEISNLNIRDFTINIDRTEDGKDMTLLVGGIAGYVGGASIIGCSVDGAIIANASKEELTYIGGVAGVVESIAIEGIGEFYSSIRSCSSAASIISDYGSYVYCAGGIAGLAQSYSEKNPCVIMNCYSTGSVEGGINAGGIAGRATEYSAILNCYSIGDVLAHSPVETGGGLDRLATSYAGGIVGYLESGCIVANSFTQSYVDASSINSGNSYAVKGDIIGAAEAAENSNLHDADGYAHNSFSANNFVNFDEEFYKNTLNWEDSDWIFDEGEYPVINHESTSITFTVKVNFVENMTGGAIRNDADELTVTDMYLSMAFWFYMDEGLPEFYNWNNLRSYGYFFDSELTKKVPYSYVPTSDITLYVGFADYSEVEGKYYIRMVESGSGVYLELSADGLLAVRDGAKNYTSYYTYDGETIRLYDNYLLTETFGYTPGYLESFVGEIVTIPGFGNEILLAYSRETLIQDYILYGFKEVEGFAYGEYYYGDATFTFNTDGTVVIDGTAANDGSFEYYFSENGQSLIISLDPEDETARMTATLLNGVITGIEGLAENVSYIDIFVGVWEKPIAAHMQYTFDGKGGWSYESFGYDGEGEKVVVISPISGSYTVDEHGVATLSDSLDAYYAIAELVDGVLMIGGEEYYNENSFAGVWIFNNREPIEIKFDGITANGYGEAVVSYGDKVGDIEINYQFTDGKLYLYSEKFAIGELEYDKANKTLSGSLFIPADGEVNEDVTFCLYDSFKGAWVSEDSTLSLVEFNGLGNYNLSGNANYLEVKGAITINDENVGVYTVTNGTLSGNFTYNSIEYTIRYDYENGLIVVNDSFNLVGLDSLYGLKLLDTDGNTYEFDGRSGVVGGGTLAVNDVEYTYTIVDGNVVISGEQSGSISLDTYTLILGDAPAKELFLNGDFEGSWIVGGIVDGAMTIGKVGADCKTQGTFMGENVEFTYDTQSGKLSFIWNEIAAVVTANKLGDITELSIVYSGDTYVCMSVENADLDEYKGTYTNGDAKIYLDGFLNSKFGGGTALIIENDEVVLSIPYQVNRFNNIIFIEEGRTYYIFIEAEDGKYQGEGVAYNLTTPGPLYNRIIYGMNADLTEINENVYYYLDGVNSVYDKNGKLVYTYEVEERTEQDMLDLVLRMVFTDVKTNKKYNVVINLGSSDLSLYMTEILTQEA